MKYALYTGCTVPLRGLGYELSARKVAEALGIKLVQLDGFSCCGFPISFIQQDSSLAMAALNICIAEEVGMPIATLCNSCTANLTKTNQKLKTDSETNKRISDILQPTGYEFSGSTKVKHIARILYEDIGVVQIEKKVKKNLEGLRIAPFYGCHYLKPSSIYAKFDDPERPKSLNVLVEATGAKAVDFPEKTLCCGGPILAIDENASKGMTQKVLDAVTENKSDAIVVVCPFCYVMFDEYQSVIGKEIGAEYNIPVFFLTQILGLALGFEPKELGLRTKGRYKKFFEKLEGVDK
jgi:heterodisulfide reductase subunit B